MKQPVRRVSETPGTHLVCNKFPTPENRSHFLLLHCHQSNGSPSLHRYSVRRSGFAYSRKSTTTGNSQWYSRGGFELETSWSPVQNINHALCTKHIENKEHSRDKNHVNLPFQQNIRWHFVNIVCFKSPWEVNSFLPIIIGPIVNRFGCAHVGDKLCLNFIS